MENVQMLLPMEPKVFRQKMKEIVKQVVNESQQQAIKYSGKKKRNNLREHIFALAHNNTGFQ